MKIVVAGALEECVYVTGVGKFLRLAEAAGWRTEFLGPAISLEPRLEVAMVKQRAWHRGYLSSSRMRWH